MRHYLRRKDTLDSYSARFVLPRGFYSEQFLHAALFKRATAHIHRDWMFCKMGRVSMNRTKQSAIDWWRSMLTQTARRIRSARTGYAFCCASASCACGAYQRRRAACPKAARLLYYTLRTRTSHMYRVYRGTTGGGTPEMPGPNAPCDGWAGSSVSTSCATGAAEAAAATAPVALSAAWGEPKCASTAPGAHGRKASRSTWSVSSSLLTPRREGPRAVYG